MRLDMTDATFVDIIHTNAMTLTYAGFDGYGIPFSIGHVDFYANGGVHQQGCPGKDSLLYC